MKGSVPGETVRGECSEIQKCKKSQIKSNRYRFFCLRARLRYHIYAAKCQRLFNNVMEAVMKKSLVLVAMLAIATTLFAETEMVSCESDKGKCTYTLSV